MYTELLCVRVLKPGGINLGIFICFEAYFYYEAIAVNLPSNGIMLPLCVIAVYIYILIF